MGKRISWFSFITIIFLGILSACNLGPSPLNTPAPTPAATLSVQVMQVPAGPQVVAQEPMAGKRLDLSPVFQFTFDRDMNQAKSADSFSLLGPDEKPVSGKGTWLDARTFSFKPDAKLQPSSAYKAVFSTDAIAADGTSPQAAIELDFQSVDSLAVGQTFPDTDAEEVDPTTTITVIFNRPVVPVTIQEEQAKLPQPIEISPATEGQGEWVNSSVYVFQPEKPLLSGSRYTVRVGTGLQDATGNPLEDSYVWQFTTRAPAIGNWGLKNGIQNPPETIENVLLDQAFEIAFLQPMDADSVTKAITLVNRESGKTFPFRLKWNEDFTFLTIEPVGRYQIASFYNLTIADTAQAKDGGMLKQGLTLKFGTVPLPRVLAMKPDPGSQAKDYDGSLTIQFASPMKFDSLKNRLQVTPQPKQELSLYYNDSDWTLYAYGLDPATEYVVRVLPGTSDLYGNTIRDEFSYTFKTGDMYPNANLVLPWTPLVYRAKGPQDVFFEYNNVTSAKVWLYQVSFDEFGRILKGDVEAVNFKPQTRPVREWSVDTNVPRNQTNRMEIKLGDPKGNSLEPGYYLIGVTGEPLDYKGNFYQGYIFTVATDNITLKGTPTEGLAWVTDLESGAPQAGVDVTFYDIDWKQLGSTTTDKDGLAYLSGISSPNYARAEGTAHLAFASLDYGSGVSAGDFGLYQNYYGVSSMPYVYLYTDRPVYRPGQEVYFKGIVRQNDDLHYSLPKQKQVYVLIRRMDEDVYAEVLSLSESGSFTGTFKLSDDAALGSYDIIVQMTEEDKSPFGNLSFRVAEYHKPEFEVSASSDPTDLLVGEKATFKLDATYYSGGAVVNGDVSWFLEASPFYFAPSKDYSQFSFSDWDRDAYWGPPQESGNGILAEGQGTTDELGHLDFLKAVDLGKSKISQTVTFNANVTDVAGSLVSGGTTLVVHQSEYYAGIRSEQYIGTAGEEQPFEAVVLDWNSKPIAKQPITVKFVERQWYSVQTQDSQGTVRWETTVKEIPISQVNTVTGEDGLAKAAFVPPHGGVYKAIVSVTDTKGHSHQASTYIWVSSSNYVAWRQTNDRAFSLIADKDSYSPGDTAEILIAQPFEQDVYALVTYERGHIYKQEVVLLKGNSTIYKLPITSDMAPMAYVSVVVVSGAENTGKPDFKIGMAQLNVDTSHQTLDVSVTADKKSAGPGEDVTYTITTKDYSGKPVSADVSLAVVDKAVLALAPMNSGPILGSFYPDQALGVRTALGIVLNADDFNENYRQSIATGAGSGSGGGGEKGEGDLGIITVRQDFKDSAYFNGQVTTDKNGTAEVKVSLPENLTTWRADVRAVTEDTLVGQTTGELVSTKPLFVQLQTPRFFIAGDEVTLGAIVHNNGEEQLKVQISLEADGVELKMPAEQSIDVPAKQQAYVTWEATVKDVTRVDLTAHAVSGSFTDASKPALGTLSDQGIPVYNFTVPETVGTAGLLQTAGSITEGFQLPTSLDYTDASLSVEVSPSLAASINDGLTYLEDFPYLCLEQTVSRFLPNVVAARALKTAGVDSGELQANLDANVNTALQRIYAKQNYDGGWGWWDSQTSDLQTSAYVVFGLMEAKESGYTVSQSVLDNGVTFLREHLSDINRNDPTWKYNRHAFLLYVLARGNQLGAGQTNYIYEHRTQLSLYGKAYLAQTMYMLDPTDKRIDSLMSDLGSATVLSAASAHWEETDIDYWNWNTDLRTTAIVLDTFVQIDPNNPGTANAVRWLMAHRNSGHWQSTQETAWSLISLTDWLTASKEYETDYQFAVGLNGDPLRQGQASADNLLDTVKLQVQLKDLLKDEVNYLVLTRSDGNGNLYYSAYLSATLPVEQVQPLDQGISVSRQYYELTDTRNKTPITEAARGDLVRVRVTIVAPAALHYAVIDDPLPAGLEPIDTSLATDTAVPTVYTLQDYTERGWGWWYFDHIELRDEKVVLSAQYLPAGTYVYTYLARASTAGTFKVIPTTASEFYFPDVAGRDAGSLFTVK
jgi:uncharacterized protein YfaS (alpha-2-macroglobulin family)